MGNWAILFIASILILGGLLISEEAFAAVFTDAFNVLGEEDDPRSVKFNSDGTKMFILGPKGDNFVYEYACTTGFDISTCTYSEDVERFNITLAIENKPKGLAFISNGTKMYVVGEVGDDVNEFFCTTGFDVSTCKFAGNVERLLSGIVSDNNPVSLAFNSDGTKLFILGGDTGELNEFACTTGFDVSTCTYSGDGERLLVNTEEADPRGLAFSSDGTKLFVIGEEEGKVIEYACDTAFDVSECDYSGDDERFSVAAQESEPQGIAFSSDGLKMFIVGNAGGVNEYELGTAYDVSSVPSSGSVTARVGGSSAHEHKTRPTFGIDHDRFIQIVVGGFSFNGVSHTITDNFWTPFAEQKIKLGEMNSFSAKVFAGYKLMIQEFLFGIPEIGDAHKAELGIEVFYNYDGTIEKVNVIQKTDIIDISSVQIMHSKLKCQSDYTTEDCYITRLSMKFLEPLKHNVMAIKAVDFKGRTQITYLNEGFDISGNSLNPMQTKMIPGTEKYEGLIEITQTAKYSDIWVAKDGREFQINEFGSVNQINQSFQRHTDNGELKNRSHSEFYRLTEYEINRAQMLLEQLCAHCSDEEFGEINDIFAYDYPETIYRIDYPELQKNLVIESEKAQKIMEHLLDPSLSSKIKYFKTLSLE